MIFSSIPGRRVRHALASLVAIGALAACGGATSQFEPFVAQRVIVFGDEISALTSEGRKFSVNATKTVTNSDGTTTVSIDCTGLSNWVQLLAGIYGFVFKECNPNNVAAPQATMWAAPDARVADVAAQIDAQVAAGGFGDKDLATVLAGSHDVIDLYEQFPTRSEDDLKAAAGERGKQVAEQVNRIVGLGARVIVVTIPDLGYTPYALKQSLLYTDTNRATLLSRLTQAFNEKLQLTILLDGRYIGLVQADLRTQSMARSPTSYGLQNVTSGVCLSTVALVDCTDKTLVEGGSASAWLWADDLRPAYSLQQQIASLAIDRARKNPF